MTSSQALSAFSAPTREWFLAEFGTPTAAQEGAWSAIAEGSNALVVAPTGSGKTLSAFLWSLDRLSTTPRPADPQHGCRVLYLSPLKALAYDVERNLRVPLAGMRAAADRAKVAAPEVSVAMRTGDTPADQRRRFARSPADILITTPESLYLLLTSAAREALRGIDTVIVDEVHAVCGTKRGAHLSLCLERLDELLPQPAQRIGLSATVRPVEETARFLGGAREVRIVKPATAKTIDLSVEVTVPDLANLDKVEDVDEYGQPSVWPSIVRRLFDLIASHHSTIVFANSRLLTERLCARLNELAAASPVPARSRPAHVMAQSEAAAGAERVLARAHHGSMSREERLLVESALKSGELPAVVATSSLELGIDMGAVDLVVQIGSPPSVAAGLQRVGRAGHQVGAISRGIVLPTHRSDLLAASVTAERMQHNGIEELRPPRNPVDVLAQHLVSMVAMEDWHVDDVATVVRRAAPFASLPDSALEAVLDMAAGKYPSTGFSGLRPKLVWDRATGRLSARRGAQRLAVLNGGTIPDRGLYGVFLSEGGQGARVGELDEEMVYESRVGDVFLLGATSWRIDAITPDRVLVTPAPGSPARMPFWKGEDPGRPAELGRAIGARVRQLSMEWAASSTLNDSASHNLLQYVAAQRDATGAVCDDRTVVMERFRDELGDWRIVVHCLLGAKVNRPWALAIAARLRQRYGIDGHVMATDDGMVMRVPDMPQPPGAELIRFDPQDIARLVTTELAMSPLFSARFRECAARALLLPRRGIQRRQPLWQQRQRAGQLFEVARDFDDFPITAEAARECLEEYFDMPELTTHLADMATGTVMVTTVVTEQASPFATSLLTSYVAGNVYGEDEPMAERRVAALNSGLLNELLGDGDQLLDEAVVAEAQTWLAWRDGRRLDDADDVAELLRVVGDLDEPELTERGVNLAVVAELAQSGRAVTVELAGTSRWIAVEDAVRYRDGLGLAVPHSIPAALLKPVTAPLDDVLARYARTHGPFHTGECAQRFGLPEEVVEAGLHRLDADRVITHGSFTSAQPQWCAVEVLRLLRRKTLAALRAEIAPVSAGRYAGFLADWQGVGAKTTGVDAVADVLGQLQGVSLPASAVETLVLPIRVGEYSPAQLDELTGSGELLWSGAGSLPGGDGWVCFAYADTAAQLLPQPDPEAASTTLHQDILSALDVARFFKDLTDMVDGEDEDVLAALWDLVWGGWISNDSLSPLRAKLAGPLPKAASSRRFGRRLRSARLTGVAGFGVAPARARATPATAAGRWYRLPERETDQTRRTYAATASLLDRNGIVVRGAAAGQSSGFAGNYPVLSAMEEKGAIRRGYFVAGLGAAQFAEPGAVDRLRSAAAQGTIVLSACDPANPFGAGIPWPARTRSPSPQDGEESGHRAGRKAGAVVVINDGELVWFLERGGRTLLSFGHGPAVTQAAARALAETARRGGLPNATLTHVDGEPIASTPVGDALSAAGFRATPKGLKFA
jgi:ATP-dependent Lhr-like helicase